MFVFKKKTKNIETPEIKLKELEEKRKRIIYKGTSDCTPGIQGAPSEEVKLNIDKCDEQNKDIEEKNKNEHKEEIEQLDQEIQNLKEQIKLNGQKTQGGKRRTRRRSNKKRTNKRKKTKTRMKKRKTSKRKTNKRRRKR